MASKTCLLFGLCFLFSAICLPTIQSKNSNPFQFLQSLENVQKIDHNYTGIKDLKKYLIKFGYLKNYDENVPAGLEDAHDNDLLAAIKLYQRSFRLNVTGVLDSDTVTQMMKPRCGVPDHVIIKPKNYGHQDDKGKSFHTVAHYQFIPGNPRWSNKQLTYSFGSTAQVPDDLNLRSAFKSAFQSWAQVTDFSFEEVAAGGSDEADIVIGFHRGYHGDRNPFDGFKGVLAHSMPPTVGTSHYDADEKWSSNSNPGLDELDLESVALHEIGHVLGLGHETGLREAVMYPTISYGQTKRVLNDDDIQEDGLLSDHEGVVKDGMIGSPPDANFHMGLVAITTGGEKQDPFAVFCNGLRGEGPDSSSFVRCGEISPKVDGLPVTAPSRLKTRRGRKSLFSSKRHNMVTRSSKACIISQHKNSEIKSRVVWNLEEVIAKVLEVGLSRVADFYCNKREFIEIMASRKVENDKGFVIW
ncbi:hypothetical protein Dsin_000285 [Dipteronia sinensis]|uniref:Peptidase metallopeptidase domain-containing protein n=1 Tax=Dipteronia sinensis TaxID=43782 RepID=A0AAE0B349_9ROSI|nr:hypothetical protein Dsin_000285 [Dipteronia sinensis]